MRSHIISTYTSEINKDHTARRIEKPANMCFAGENGCRIKHERCGTRINAFRRTSPIASPRAVLAESIYRIDTTLSRDFMILPSPPRNSVNARACFEARLSRTRLNRNIGVSRRVDDWSMSRLSDFGSHAKQTRRRVGNERIVTSQS
jgi:hypothetical protein